MPAPRPSSSSVHKPRGLRVGFAFNVKRVKPHASGAHDEEAEYDSPKTLQSIRDAIESHGHTVVDLEATPALLSRLPRAKVDLVFNVSEGQHGRNREAHVPALCEMLQIPYTGSDVATLALSLDKALAKKIVAQEGVPTPHSMLMTTGREPLPKGLRFPLIVKPVAEGSSKGVLAKSVVTSEKELRRFAREMAERYRQPALVEEYIKGREFTVGLLGHHDPEVLPPMEVVFTDPSDPLPVYSFEHKLDWNDQIRYEAPAKLPKAVTRRMQELARRSFLALGCRDVARIDFRMDARTGEIHFIEANPLPGLTPGWSDLVLIAQGVGMDYETLIGRILAGAIARWEASGKKPA